MRDTLIILMLVSIIVDVWLVVFTTTRPDRRRTSSFTLLCFSLLVYSLGYIAELFADTPGEAFIALITENFGISNIPFLYLLTSASLFAPPRYKKNYLYYALAYAIILFTIVLTTGYHQLYYTAIDMVSDGTGNFLRLSKGPIYFIHQGVTAVCIVASYMMMLTRFFRGSRKLKRQMFLFIIGSLLSFTANILNVSGVLPAGLDPVPLALTLSLVLFSINLVRDDLMDVVVRARNTAVETMDKAFVVLDNDLDFLYCNKSATRLFPQLNGFEGTEPISSIEHWPEGLFSLKDKQLVNFSLEKEGKACHYRAEVEQIHRAGRPSIGYSIIISDVTDETLLIDQLERLATTDPLTGILNRRRLFEMIERELEIAKRFDKSTAIIMFDLDHFKRINDVYGHNAGDDVLKAACSCIQSALRVYDIFGRIGGEEFIIFTQSPGAVGLVNFANRLRKILEKQRVPCGDESIKFTASFGIVEIPPGGNLKEAIFNADQAMYRAKDAGRNRVALHGDSFPGETDGE